MLNYTETLIEGSRPFNCATQAVTVTLLSSTIAPMKQYMVQKLDSNAYAITISCAAGDTFVGGATSLTIPAGAPGFSTIRRGGPGIPIVVVAGAGSAASTVPIGQGLYYNAAGQLMQGTAPNPGNMLPNSNFNVVNNSIPPMPVGWTRTPGYVSFGSSSDAFSGSTCLESITNTGFENFGIAQNIACNPGDSYYGQFWIKATPGYSSALIGLYVSFFDVNNAFLSRATIASVTSPPASYTAYGSQFTVPPGAASMNVNGLLEIGGTAAFCGAVALVNTITNPVIAPQAVQAVNMAANSITAANAAIAASAVVDSNIVSLGINKVTYGTSIFAGDVVLSRGIGLPVIVLRNTDLTLFGQADASLGATGLTSKPYVQIAAGQALFYGGNTGGGGTGPSLTLSGSAATFWQVNGSISNPFLQLSPSGAVISDGGSTTLTAYSGSITLLNVSNSNQLSVSASGVVMSNGTYNLTVGMGNITMTGSPYTITLNTSTGVTISSGGSAGNPKLTITSSTLTIQNNASSPNNSILTLGASGGTWVGGAHQAAISSAQFAITNTGAFTGSVYLSAVSPQAAVTINGGPGGGTASLACSISTGYGTLSIGTNAQPSNVQINGNGTISLVVGGAVSVNGQQVLTGRQSGVGNPSGALTSFAAVQAWCNNLWTALSSSGHGLIS